MKKQLFAALFASCAGLALRLLELTRGFDTDGLPNGSTFYVPYALAAIAGALALFSRTLPGRESVTESFADIFDFSSPLPTATAVMGAFMLLAGAGLSVLDGGFAPAALLPAVLLLLCAAAMFYCVFALRRGEDFSPIALLVPVCYLLVLLILLYRVNSKDPVLLDYYPAILAAAALCLAYLLLAAFAYRNGSPRRFSAAASLAVLFSFMAALDSMMTHSFSFAAIFLGFALLPLAFMAAAEFDG